MTVNELIEHLKSIPGDWKLSTGLAMCQDLVEDDWTEESKVERVFADDNDIYSIYAYEPK